MKHTLCWLVLFIAFCCPKVSAKQLDTMVSQKNLPAYNQLITQFANIPPKAKVLPQLTIPAGQTIFAGSSTFDQWPQIDSLFAEFGAHNRAIGGIDIRYLIAFGESLLLKYQPEVVVLYIGDNDMLCMSFDEFESYFKCWVANLFHRFPKSKLVLVSLKPSPSRLEQHADYQKINSLYKSLSETQNIYYVEIWSSISTNPALYFKVDGLHINSAGYELLAAKLLPVLRQLK